MLFKWVNGQWCYCFTLKWVQCRIEVNSVSWGKYVGTLEQIKIYDILWVFAVQEVFKQIKYVRRGTTVASCQYGSLHVALNYVLSLHSHPAVVGKNTYLPPDESSSLSSWNKLLFFKEKYTYTLTSQKSAFIWYQILTYIWHKQYM